MPTEGAREQPTDSRHVKAATKLAILFMVLDHPVFAVEWPVADYAVDCR